MNNEYHENGALRSPLIFTVRYPLVMALYFNWLDEANRAGVPSQFLEDHCCLDTGGGKDPGKKHTD